MELSKAKYSRHIVPKLLQYGTRPQRDAIIVQYYGHVRRLMRQKVRLACLHTLLLFVVGSGCHM